MLNPEIEKKLRSLRFNFEHLLKMKKRNGFTSFFNHSMSFELISAYEQIIDSCPEPDKTAYYANWCENLDALIDDLQKEISFRVGQSYEKIHNNISQLPNRLQKDIMAYINIQKLENDAFAYSNLFSVLQLLSLVKIKDKFMLRTQTYQINQLPSTMRCSLINKAKSLQKIQNPYIKTRNAFEALFQLSALSTGSALIIVFIVALTAPVLPAMFALKMMLASLAALVLLSWVSARLIEHLIPNGPLLTIKNEEVEEYDWPSQDNKFCKRAAFNTTAHGRLHGFFDEESDAKKYNQLTQRILSDLEQYHRQITAPTEPAVSIIP